jgi:hypothetical protein
MIKQPYDKPIDIEDNNSQSLREHLCEEEMDLREYMRLLWEQHVYWTRMTIISIANNLPDEEATTKRLLRNAKDFERAFKPFYGSRAAHEFGRLITDHLVIAAELVKAAKAGNKNAAANAEKRWYANADEIVSFLTHINHFGSEEHMRQMWYQHLSLTKSEALAILTGDYNKGISTFDQVEEEALLMADNFATGIIKQFPPRSAQ